MQSGAASGLRSAAVTQWLNGGLARVGVGWRFSERLVRKLGHFSEYALLGFWLMLSLRVYTRRILSHISWPLFSACWQACWTRGSRCLRMGAAATCGMW